jgi:hypothetical protein
VRSPRLTVRLHPWALGGLERIASLLGASVGQVASAVLELLSASSASPTTEVGACRPPTAYVRVRLTSVAWYEVLSLRERVGTVGPWKGTDGLLVGGILSDFVGGVDASNPTGSPDLATALDRTVPGGLPAFYRTVHRRA